jgi:CelD/BcsL family acetyltransferase involved in cellulose biosynthesis
MSGDGSVYRGLASAIRQRRRRCEVESYLSRPLLAPVVSAEKYLDIALRKKRQRQFNRKRELLAEVGPISFQVTDDEALLAAWADDFIDLEARGWKGREGSAMKLRMNEGIFFRTLVRRGAGRKKVRAYRLSAGQTPVAMRFDLITGGAGFAFKIAYDERYAKLSPGGLLEIEILRDFFERGDLRFIDSCTIPSPDSIHGYFWAESRSVSSLVVGAPTLAGETLVGFGQLIRRWRGGRGVAGTPSRDGQIELSSESASSGL